MNSFIIYFTIIKYLFLYIVYNIRQFGYTYYFFSFLSAKELEIKYKGICF